MEGDNDSVVTEFILVGISGGPHVKFTLFGFLFAIYLLTLVGNTLLILLTRVDLRLHTPMYFFLSNLSFLDICYITINAPQLMVHCLSKRPSISLGRCLAQMYISRFLGITECLLLAVMAYDRWVAICKPLRYTLVMNNRVCLQLAAMSWSGSFLLCLSDFLPNQPRFCRPNTINHFACELQAMLKLACSDTRSNQIVMVSTSVLVLLVPFSFILVAYVHIIAAVLRIHSTQGRTKAFSTCASHITVVALFYGAAIFVYLRPQSKSSPDQDKYISLFYGAVTPVLNPLIYSLRNKDVKEALKKLAGRKMNY
ncbi:olfactory receptor 13H1-like [Trachemys scripta elegans]|uniref:olfactory receptor 13H1-like n=1 Tax=Trachemys scripta elegans TaxID=31138 RepID=UPI001553EC2D|nr:olfactory receptor 13H1-like [Trachemys scripta elegans]